MKLFFLEIFNVQIASVFFSFFLFCVHCRNFWIYLNQKRRMLLLRKKATLMCPLQKKVTLMCQKLNQELILPVNQRNQKGQWVAFIIKHVVLTKNSWLSWIAYYCQSCFGSDKSLIFSPQDRSVLAFVPNSFYLFIFLVQIRRLLPASSILLRDFSTLDVEDDVEKPKVSLILSLIVCLLLRCDQKV